MMNSDEELIGVGESDTIVLFYIMFIVFQSSSFCNICLMGGITPLRRRLVVAHTCQRN